MSYGPIQVFATTGIVSGASTLTSVAIAKAFSRVALEVGTASTEVIIDVYGSTDNVVFRPVMERVNTATIQYATMAITSQVVVGGGIAELSTFGYPYLQLRASAVVSGGIAIKLIGMD